VNEIDALSRFRPDTPTMSPHAQAHGRLRLIGEINARPARTHRWLPGRRSLLLAGIATVLTVAVLGYQVVGPPTAGSAAEAATVLNRAAAAVFPASGPAPRADQFIYLDVLMVTSGMKQRTQTWTAVDGSRPGLIQSAGFLRTRTTKITPYDQANGLHDAPYAVLAKLPTDPEALLGVLYDQPWVKEQMRANHLTRDTAVWNLLRELVVAAPPVQKAALFETAARIKGITYVKNAVDAAGRSGEAVGLDVRGLGNVQFIFDRTTHAFLGERILDPGSTTRVQFNNAIQQTAVVDTAGKLPS
jgi:hypothetical protein